MTNTHPLIRWVTEVPPVMHKARALSDRKAFVETLKANPGRWAIYKPEENHHPGTGHAFKKNFPGTEATVRLIPDTKPKRYSVYVRWVGP